MVYTYVVAVRFSVSSSMSAIRALEIGLPMLYAFEEDISPDLATDCGSSVARGVRGGVLAVALDRRRKLERIFEKGLSGEGGVSALGRRVDNNMSKRGYGPALDSVLLGPHSKETGTYKGGGQWSISPCPALGNSYLHPDPLFLRFRPRSDDPLQIS